MELMETDDRCRMLDSTQPRKPKANSKIQDQHSTQENTQDLDQQQQVDVKPSQINLQKIDVTVNTKLENYSGKISGIIYKGNDNVFAANAEIILYFGCISDFPVFKTNSDENGCYSIDELPPGFYTIKVRYNDSLGATQYNIKVFPGQNSDQPLFLTGTSRHEKRKY